MREADARPEGAHAKCGVLQPSTGPERWTTGCGFVAAFVIIRTSHGAHNDRQGDRIQHRCAWGQKRGAKGGRWSCGTGVCPDPEKSKGSTAISDTLGMRHVCRGVGCV
jgi:hypothetical protein